MTGATAPTVDTKTDDWPTFHEVLTRKASEQLQIWMDRYDRGVINLSAAICAVSVLYDATSGMINKDLSDLIADVHRDLTLQAKAKKPH